MENYNLYRREILMLNLNKCEIDFERLFKRAPIVLTKRTPQILDNSVYMEVRQQATFVVANKYIELAYAYYVLENFPETKSYFEKAAPFAFLRGFDPELKTSHNDWTIQQDLNIVLLFAEQEVLEKLKHSEIKLSSVQHQAKLQYVELLKNIVTGGTPEQSDIDAALLETKNTKDKDVLQYILPLIEAISALTSADITLWQASIDKAIKWHADECKFGDYKDMEEGFICLNALTMAKLGKDLHGWQCQTNSLYLPLFLID